MRDLDTALHDVSQMQAALTNPLFGLDDVSSTTADFYMDRIGNLSTAANGEVSFLDVMNIVKTGRFLCMISH